jgi:hypothetical protein
LAASGGYRIFGVVLCLWLLALLMVSAGTGDASQFWTVGEFSFELSDPLVEEAVVVAGPGKPFLEPAGVLGGLAELGSEIVVLGEDPLNAIFWQVVPQVADAAEQLADLGPLGGELTVCPLELMFCVQGPFPPARLRGVCLVVLAAAG